MIPHETVSPGGTATMEVRISVLDSAANFPCTYEIEALVPPGESVPAYLVREASPPGTPPTTTNDIVVGTPTVNPVLVLGGQGTTSSFVDVTVPVNVDASNGPVGALSWNHLYEMSVTITPIQPIVDGPDANTDPDFDTCYINYREGTTTSEWGTNLSDPSLRELNGDLCVVPNGDLPNGGELAVMHGFLHDPDPVTGDLHPYAYHGHFGGHFLDENGDPTVADFKRRVIEENITSIHTDTCFDQAVAKGYNPDAVGCPDLTTIGIPAGSEWVVGLSTCAAPPMGEWGVCCHGPSLDVVGRHLDCVDQYLSEWTSPRVPAAGSGCEFGALQRMRMHCRKQWDWSYDYVPAPWSLGQTFIWDDIDSNGDGIPDDTDRHATSWRSSVSVDATRAWETPVVPAVCTP